MKSKKERDIVENVKMIEKGFERFIRKEISLISTTFSVILTISNWSLVETLSEGRTTMGVGDGRRGKKVKQLLLAETHHQLPTWEPDALKALVFTRVLTSVS